MTRKQGGHFTASHWMMVEPVIIDLFVKPFFKNKDGEVLTGDKKALTIKTIKTHIKTSKRIIVNIVNGRKGSPACITSLHIIWKGISQFLCQNR